MELADALDAADIVIALLAVLEKVAELQRPELAELRSRQHGIDELRTLRRFRTRDERRHFVGGWEDSAGVQVKPAHELIVRAQVRRLDVQFAELGEDMRIDEVVPAFKAARHRRDGRVAC